MCKAHTYTVFLATLLIYAHNYSPFMHWNFGFGPKTIKEVRKSNLRDVIRLIVDSCFEALSSTFWRYHVLQRLPFSLDLV